MPTIGNTYLTLADAFRQQDANREIADVIEMLAQYNTILEDAPAMECNQGATHLTTVRTGLPTPVWRRLYQGVRPTKGTTAQVSEATGFMETWSEVDARLVELQKNPAKFRLNEANAHLEALAQEAARTIIYGDVATEPEKFTGLAPRFSSKSAPNGTQIIDGGGTGNTNTSMWFVTWGENAAHLLYPEGTRAGIQREDKGKQTRTDADGGLYDVYREKFVWHLGLSVRDWRGVSRIANIDVNTLTADASSGAKLIDLMIDAYYALQNPNQPSGRTVIYCNKRIMSFLHKQAMNKVAYTLTFADIGGRPILTFLGSPIRRVDALVENEPRVT